MAKYLTEYLLSEMNRARDLIPVYKGLPNGVGFIPAELIEIEIKIAEIAITTGDIIKMLLCYKNLRNYDSKPLL